MAKSDEAKARERRLALKLRENLRRRKAPVGTRGSDEATAARGSEKPQKHDDK